MVAAQSKSQFSVLIVEDELLIAEMLSGYMAELQYAVAGVAGDYETAIHLLETQPLPDLCLLDINLESSRSGLDLATELQQKFKLPFVFLTSYADTRTIENAITCSPEAYLLKPIRLTDLFTTIEIIRNRKQANKETSTVIVVKDGSLTQRINVMEILWIKSDHVYIELKLSDRKLLLRKSLDGFLSEHNLDFMVRVHRSYAVNLYHLKSLNGSNLQVGTDNIPLSRLHKEELISKFRNFNP